MSSQQILKSHPYLLIQMMKRRKISLQKMKKNLNWRSRFQDEEQVNEVKTSFERETLITDDNPFHIAKIFGLPKWVIVTNIKI